MRNAAVALAILCCGATPVAVASTSPLREIDHSAITQDICANVVVHANSAIAATLRGDERLARALVRLRGNDLDDGAPSKRAAISELAGIAGSLEENSARGSEEIRRLRALAETAPREHARDLGTFAGALANVLERHAKTGSELAGLVGTLDLREVRGTLANSTTISEPVENTRGISRSNGIAPARPSFTQSPASPLALAHALAAEIEKRQAAGAVDETTASDRAEAAVTGC